MTAQISVSSSKADGLLFTRMRSRERLGELFSFEVEFESEDTAIDLSGLLKSPMAVTLETQDGYKRYFHGMVCEAEQTSVERVQSLVYAKYRVHLVPKPWLLGQMLDCHIFKNKTVVEIVKEVLADAGYTDVSINLSGSYPKREYCVQYREDGLNFIHRLLQQEGIYYYFTHTASKHEMVLADGVGSHAQASGFENGFFDRTRNSVLKAQSTISSWTSLRGVDGATCELTDYNPLKPKASLLSTASSDGHGAPGISVFDYPGTHAEAARGKHFAQMRAEALSAARSRYLGETDACAATIGCLFNLSGHPREENNAEYLMTAATLELEGPGHASGAGNTDPTFASRFEALESAKPWRSPQTARQPVVTGLQTAIVTGSETDEDIAVDEYGRVQVNFHWNMPGKEGALCSCQVRVASSWAGKAWGAISIPRVGQEVVVSFIEGDPNYPLIVGSVYNGVNTPPYKLPANKTQSGVKSRSLLGGTADFNELRFEDKKGSEDFFMHAQKDMHKEVENDYTVTIDHDQIVTIKNDETRKVENNQTETITKNRTLKIDGEDKIDVAKKGATTIGTTFKLDVGDKLELVCGQASITMKSSGEIDIKGSNIKINGKQKVDIKGKTGVAISGMNVKLKADMKAEMKGVMVKVEGSGKTDLKGAMVNVTGSGMVKVGGGMVMLG